MRLSVGGGLLLTEADEESEGGCARFSESYSGIDEMSWHDITCFALHGKSHVDLLEW